MAEAATQKKAVLKSFAISQENTLCWSLFLIKMQDFRSAISLQRDSDAGVNL